jgi:peptidoglycan hydrolase-like protein with peptidoglycan-binding domain
MRVIRAGMSGPDVEVWQLFLIGQGHTELQADGEYDARTLAATRDWQGKSGLPDDGVIGPRTFGKAQELGFNPGFEDSDPSEAGPNWPPKPAFSALDADGRKQRFGDFAFRPKPVPGNEEAIEITDDWPARNIEVVDIPQLVGLQNAPANGRVRLHKLAVDPFRKFFQAVDDAGLKKHLLSFAGTYAPRFIRGSRTRLSNHAYGSAIDLNVPWNMLGTVPALKGKKGSVREIVPIANAHGLYWGGHFTRADGMHFELAKIG